MEKEKEGEVRKEGRKWEIGFAVGQGGLGGLTDGLRQHLKNLPKRIMLQQQDLDDDSSSDSDSS
eukprot:987379-Amorphochlora_amoeboformis.AAC.1